MKFAIRTLSAAIILATSAPVLALTLEERIAKGFEVAADRNAGNCFAVTRPKVQSWRVMVGRLLL